MRCWNIFLFGLLLWFGGIRNGWSQIEIPEELPIKENKEDFLSCVLYLKSQSVLHGSLLKIENQKILFKSPEATQPIEFSFDKIKQIEILTSNNIAPKKTKHFICLLSGEMIPGTIISLNEKQTIIQDINENNIQIATSQIQSIMNASLGELIIYGFGNSTCWEFKNKKLVEIQKNGNLLKFSQQTHLTHPITPGDAFKVEFDLYSSSNFNWNLFLYFHKNKNIFQRQGSLNVRDSSFISFYNQQTRILTINHTWKPGLVVSKDKPAHIILYISPKTGKFQIYQDKKMLGEGDDFFTQCHFLTIQSTQSCIENFKFLPWDGKTVGDNSIKNEPSENDLLTLANMDAIQGKLVKITEDSLIFNYQNTDMTIPFNRVFMLQLNNSQGKPIIKNDFIQIELWDGSFIYAKQIVSKSPFYIIDSTSFQTFKVSQKQVKSITFSSSLPLGKNK